MVLEDNATQLGGLERRIARDGVAYTYAGFASWYEGHPSIDRIWNDAPAEDTATACIDGATSVAAGRPSAPAINDDVVVAHGLATEHADVPHIEQVPILLAPEQIVFSSSYSAAT